ncbi:hypothetical protein JHK87_048064 [Glycine soja]|nr:hypothetical protein JHK87_048064 [Glycine soja]
MGDSILALASNGIHLVWRWPRNGFNLDGKIIILWNTDGWKKLKDKQLQIQGNQVSWLPEVPIIHISQATFSSDGHTVYSIFGVAIFDASNFEIGFRVYRSCYLPTISRWGGVYPISVAAHPQKPVQFAVGLLDGSVYVFEPRMPGGDWIKNH